MREIPLRSIVVGIFLIFGCAKSQQPQNIAFCAPKELPKISSGDLGSADIFLPDPMSSSGNVHLLPTSNHLDDYRTVAGLSHLNGLGVLQGKYVGVVNETSCGGWYGAYDSQNHFSYSHKDTRFQETMAYYFGDAYRSYLDSTSYLNYQTAITIKSPCALEDNAYFSRASDKQGNLQEVVCLGGSSTSPGAYYADDGIVTVHELQHATTLDNYSMEEDLNQFEYDEAGALNEAISDFMGLMFINKITPPNPTFDFSEFSRWALGTFDYPYSQIRGAHRCPTYDSSYGLCAHFPSFSTPTRANGSMTTISYVYPDGLGWPYTGSESGTDSLRKVYLGFKSQEEIHNADLLMLGTLWDIYTGIKLNHAGDEESVNPLMTKVILESVRHLPVPNTVTNHSPVTYIEFASSLNKYGIKIDGITSDDQNVIRNTLKQRGLYDYDSLAPGWADVGEGTNYFISRTNTPGVYISKVKLAQDGRGAFKIKDLYVANENASLVKSRVKSSSVKPSSVLRPGDAAAIWFDIQNNSDLTAGGVLVNVTSLDPDITILGQSVNNGFMIQTAIELGLNQTQVMYGKINGKKIVDDLNSVGSESAIPIGNTYFKTNPYFYRAGRTAVWIYVEPTARHGKKSVFHVQVMAANSDNNTSIQATHLYEFPVMIR